MEAAVAQIHPTIAGLRPGQRFEGRYACVAKDRLTARNGSTYLSLRAPRPERDDWPPGCSATPTGSALRFDAGDAVIARGRAERYPRRAGRRARRRPPARAGQLRPGRVPARRLPVDRRAGGLSRAPDPRGPRPGAPRGGRADDRQRAGRGRFPTRPLHPGGHHAYLGGLLEHTVAVGTLVGETCALHPRLDSDLLMAAAIAPRRRPGARVHLRRRVRDHR